MSDTAPQLRPRGAVDRGECRRCSVWCDRIVYPSSCLERGCPNLYSYTSRSGRRFAGCMAHVFGAEIDLDVLELATGAGGFGALKCVGEPLPVCRTDVERAYGHREDEIGCVNPEFAERRDEAAFRVFVRVDA
jgi:hypothetical protein